ncbi:hypothetical protein GCM10011571_24620 [Marinithermofilum abyssi]|uniref:Prepilin type IV endopeptidase peptidase domain-containing protein n=1 Tax=Marinithermofilum abyssi TaxID=1571185 RepID=A0A8J2YEC9_9BACL|nr:A24 family peptidase [Marinithermofilum abyssi]GGE21602.1 hypothetical protein GCM10011571_24620 [Marinithermofilum abyssi]
MTEHLLYMTLILLLTYATYTDLKERLIYDRVVIGGVLAALIFHLWEPQPPWLEYLFTGIGVLFGLATIAVLTGGSAIGGGDIKVFAMIGFALGFEGFFIVFSISHVLAALYMIGVKLIRSQSVKWGTEFPFAPFILLGILITYTLRWVM